MDHRPGSRREVSARAAPPADPGDPAEPDPTWVRSQPALHTATRRAWLIPAGVLASLPPPEEIRRRATEAAAKAQAALDARS